MPPPLEPPRPRPPRVLDVERLLPADFAVDFRAVDLRAVPVFVAPRLPLLAAPVPLDLEAREPLLFVAVDFLALERELVDPDLPAPLEREPVERDLPVPLLRELDARRVPPLLLDELLLDPLSSDHLPLITRCAASATASAISEPRRVALDITLLAALVAESAASIPASRIFLRADGLALIAAAAAARPAASISLLIAALVILSTVVSLELEFELDFDDLDFAIANLPVRSHQ